MFQSSGTCRPCMVSVHNANGMEAARSRTAAYAEYGMPSRPRARQSQRLCCLESQLGARFSTAGYLGVGTCSAVRREHRSGRTSRRRPVASSRRGSPPAAHGVSTSWPPSPPPRRDDGRQRLCERGERRMHAWRHDRDPQDLREARCPATPITKVNGQHGCSPQLHGWMRRLGVSLLIGSRSAR